MTWEEHVKSAKRLRAAGTGSLVVLTPLAGKNGLATRFPIGEITGFDRDDNGISVWVRKIGQKRPTSYASGFWELAPNRLVSQLK